MRKTKLFPALIVGAFFFSAAIVGCNGSGDSKDTKDSTTVKTTDTMKMVAPKDTMMKKDTMKMDTNAVKTMGKKPIVPGSGSGGN